MTTTASDEPAMPDGRFEVRPPPPPEPPDAGGGLLANALPMLGSVGSVVMVATMGGGGGRQYVAAGMFLLASLGFVAVQVDRQRKQRRYRVTGSRADYLHHLATVRAAAREAAAAQRRALLWHHPPPAALPAVAEEGSRVWERGPGHPRFLEVRFATGPAPLALELAAPELEAERADRVAEAALRRLLAAHRPVPELPCTLDLSTGDHVTVTGDARRRCGLARALICAATVLHSPEDLRVAVLTHDPAVWDWLKWLPHARSAAGVDGCGGPSLVTHAADRLVALLPPAAPEESRPHLLLVVDGAPLPPDSPLPRRERLTVVHLGEQEATARLRIDLDHRVAQEAGGEPVPVTADDCPLAVAEACARRLATRAAPGAGGRRPIDNDLPGLLGLDDVRSLDPTAAWRLRTDRDELRVPIGVANDGSAVVLDLKEAAQHGMGPHGLVVGATGSGKSELLRTLVLGLAATHSPERLNLLLVDFKGGATFAGMAALPHVSAMITNLSDELALVGRVHEALAGELVRRQEVLRAAGSLTSVRDYHRARAKGADLPPLPSMLVVVDEFTELLTARPEFLDVFVAVGRLGRSLGLHLLLSSQRVEEGRLRGLESHLSYRIGLRTFSAQESRAVLGVPDAYELPAVPGLGFLQSDPTTRTQFRAAFVSGPARRATRNGNGQPRRIVPFTVTQAPTAPAPPVATEPEGTATVLDVVVRRLSGHGPRARRIWLPPLDVPDTLDRLMPDLAVDPADGLLSPRWRGLRMPVGTVDRPREQRRDPLVVDLASTHVAVVGGPRSGKSTLLRTLVAATALTSTPRETQVFALDLAGGALAALADLSHVAAVATRTEPEAVRRVVAELRSLLDRREAWLREQEAGGVDGMERHRAVRRAGDDADGYGDVVLVVDGWAALRAEFDDLDRDVQQLAARGLAIGVHVVAAAARWADFRPAMRDLLGTRLELRLGEAIDSDLDRRAAALVPRGRPGRGLVPGPLHFLAALPRVDGVSDPATLAAGLADLVDRVGAAWTGPPAPRLRPLPGSVPLEQVRSLAPDEPGLLLGIEESGHRPVSLDPDTDPHLLVLGEGGSGKTTVLRSLVREIVRTRTPDQAQIVLVDYRRSLLGEVPGPHLLDHLATATAAEAALAELASYLRGRLPGPVVTPEQLRSRSWWSGAEVFVLVDDYDLVATGMASPLVALQPLLAQARDVGLHVMLARRSGGAARALYEPAIQTLRDLAAPGLLLSGNPEEGPLLGGVRPAILPPGRARLLTRDGSRVVQLARS